VLRVFVDSNVIVVAIRDPTTPSARVAKIVASGALEVVLTDALLREVARAARREFGVQSSKIAYQMLARAPARHVVWEFEWQHLLGEIRPLVLDRGDLPHVCAALVSDADAFVTLDDKLARMPIRRKLAVIRPEVLLRSLGGPR